MQERAPWSDISDRFLANVAWDGFKKEFKCTALKWEEFPSIRHPELKYSYADISKAPEIFGDLQRDLLNSHQDRLKKRLDEVRSEIPLLIFRPLDMVDGRNLWQTAWQINDREMRGMREIIDSEPRDGVEKAAQIYVFEDLAPDMSHLLERFPHFRRTYLDVLLGEAIKQQSFQVAAVIRDFKSTHPIQE